MKVCEKLGFGCMRMPKGNEVIDHKQACCLFDAYLEAGFSYFDTAYIYNGSEECLNSALVQRHSRESYQIASKLPLYLVDKSMPMISFFNQSLSRLGVSYLDVYLLHGIDDFWCEKANEMGAWEFLQSLKQSGKVKYTGFSFHGSPSKLDEVLSDHKEIDIVQLQINYADWMDSKIQSKKLYAIARKHGKPIIIMEPVKGGLLANPDLSSANHLRSLDSQTSIAAWAMRFVNALDGVFAILSGMNDISQIMDNSSVIKDNKPLTDEEWDALLEAGSILRNTPRIACTGCGYCTSVCPMKIKIPILIDLYNDYIVFDSLNNFKHMYNMYTEDGTKASICMSCRQCEERCPQKINVMSLVEEISRLMDEML